jgi:O-6-methylguanine DNA methyltransferase
MPERLLPLPANPQSMAAGASVGAAASVSARLRANPQSLVESTENLRPYLDQLRQYFAGERREFTLPLDLHGTEFQLRCWHALLEIGYGEIRTYAQLARTVDSPKGFRAVGAANGANPVSIIVPCHRVIASDGTLGGYGGGLEVKEKLLRLEGVWPISTGQLG